jgi:integrase
MAGQDRVAKLTKRTIDACTPAATRYTVWDAELKGFGLRVAPTGVKSYIARYRMGGGRAGTLRQITLGRHGVITPDEARALARKTLGAVAHGGDPALDRLEERAGLTLGAVVEAFLAEHADKKLKPRTAAFYRWTIEKHVLPKLGARPLKGLKESDFARLHLVLADAPYQANRTLTVIGSVFAWAGRRGIIPRGESPVRHIERYQEQRRERFLSMEELETLGATLRLGETAGIPLKVRSDKRAPKAELTTVLSPYAVGAIRLLLFTGARRQEILNLRWSEVDFDRGALHLPDSKTGRKTILLNAPALAVLASMPRVEGNPFVIVGSKPRAPLTDLNRPWDTVRRHAQLGSFRLHDLRHTFASFGASSNLGLPMIGKLLGHTQSATTARYAHLADDPLRRAAEQIGGALSAALDGRGTGAEVILMADRGRASGG